MSLRLEVEGADAGGRPVSIGISEGRFCRPNPLSSARRIEWSDGVILPGLVNAHDHLGFDLFPRLGRGGYENFTEWAGDIYRPDEPPVKDVLRVPIEDRLLWGGWKNLLSGTTTVVHHDPHHAVLDDATFPVRAIVTRWAHSFLLEPNVRAAMDRGSPLDPFVVHAAEGKGIDCEREILALERIGALGERTWLVHAIALGSLTIDVVRRAGSGVVWCPSSNRFLYGTTLSPDVFASGIPILLGTDSLASGEGDLLDEMRIALETGLAGRDEILEMVGRRAGREFLGPRGEPLGGRLEPGAPADLLLLESADPFRASRHDVALVLRAGLPAVGRPRFEPLFDEAGVAFDRLTIDGVETLVVAGLSELVRRTKRVLPEREAFVGARIEPIG